MENNINNFTKFEDYVKIHEEEKPFDELKQQYVMFDANTLELGSVTDILIIMQELNSISKKIFVYGSICESQNRVVQQLEDEFSRWMAEKHVALDQDVEPLLNRKGEPIGTYKRIDRSGPQKDKIIMVKFRDEYAKFQSKLRNENYKLGMLKRVVASLENYSYKLHAMKDYCQAIEKRGQ